MGSSAESEGNGPNSGAGGVLDSARAVAGDIQEKVAEGVSRVRGNSGNMQAGLADWLDQSAQVIRERATAENAAGENSAGGAPGASAQIPPKLANAADTAAGVLERGAMWLRETDLTDLEARVTEQVKSRPVQSLLLAAGIGFLLSRGRD